MRAIAEGCVCRVLTVAKPHLFLFCEGELLRREACAFVGTIAHWLVAGEPAGAPPVVARFKFNCDRSGSVDFGKVGHGRDGIR